MPRAKSKMSRVPLSKTPTGIDGLDEVTGGGLPKGRTTLVWGSAGCGKTLLAMEFLAHGALQYGEPGVCIERNEIEEPGEYNLDGLFVRRSHPVKSIKAKRVAL